jgi:general stress protein CsbA
MYWLITILGVALIGAPFVFGYTSNTTAFWSSIILGAMIALASGYKAYAKDAGRWEDWVDVIAGIVAVLVPFVFGFSALATALWACVILGVAVVALSGYQLYTTSEAR